MSEATPSTQEGSLEAPTRHPLDWRNPDFYNEDKLYTELERVYDICHGCRRCVSLCNAFPVLFDLVDESDTLEVDGVQKGDYWQVVDQCYLCDLCYMTKCPYVPPHEWNVDFPHLMLRAKAIKHRKGESRIRDRLLTSTDQVGRLASIPVVAEVVNMANSTSLSRKVLEATLGVHADAPLPKYHSNTARKRLKRHVTYGGECVATDTTTGRVAVFATCYGNRNLPEMVEDLVTVLEYNKIAVRLPDLERCCGMPKLELGDLDSVEKLKEINIPQLAALVDDGWDLTAVIPSCVLMFKQELRLMFPDDGAVAKVARAFFDPFEYLMLRHKAELLQTEFQTSLGTVVYHAPCHQRVQNIGPKTKDVLELIPDTTVELVERCSGHDGTYALKKENYAFAQKICRPVVNRVEAAAADHFVSDCPMAGDLIKHGANGVTAATAFSLLKLAYGI